MGAGHSYEGRSGKQYDLLLTDVSDPSKLPRQGGLIIITNSNPDEPLFIGAAASLSEAFRNLHVWPKRELPSGNRVYLAAFGDDRYKALNDLVERYNPPMNDQF